MRCPSCGHSNPDSLFLCSVCHGELRPSLTVEYPPYSHEPLGTLPLLPDRLAGALRANQATDVISLPGRAIEAMPQDRASPHMFSGTVLTSPPEQRRVRETRSDVTGRVIAIEPQYLERPDFDLCRAITKTLWLLLLVVSPLVFLHAVLVTLGGFSAIIALVGILFLARYLFPTNLFSLFYLATMANPLGPRREADQVPVRYLRIRDRNEETEHVIRMKGSLSNGNLMPDDLVSIWGSWRGGVLHARQAYSHRTQTWVELQRSYSWVSLALTLCVVVLLVAYFYGPVSHLWMRIQEMGIHQ